MTLPFKREVFHSQLRKILRIPSISKVILKHLALLQIWQHLHRFICFWKWFFVKMLLMFKFGNICKQHGQNLLRIHSFIKCTTESNAPFNNKWCALFRCSLAEWVGPNLYLFRIPYLNCTCTEYSSLIPALGSLDSKIMLICAGLRWNRTALWTSRNLGPPGGTVKEKGKHLQWLVKLHDIDKNQFVTSIQISHAESFCGSKFRFMLWTTIISLNILAVTQLKDTQTYEKENTVLRPWLTQIQHLGRSCFWLLFAKIM